jgi:hypothetical protein
VSGLSAAEYVLPLRWEHDSDLAGRDELTDYLTRLSRWVAVTVVDGSPPEVFATHAEAWRGFVRHLAPESWPGRNRKVGAVVTGVRHARHSRVVIADDDVRYDKHVLDRVLRLLDDADLVRPQNVFATWPWHARWDTGRSLLNRAVAADYPGTFGLRRGLFLAMGGYDGDVLFENLEMVRTVRAAGGREVRPRNLYVHRLAPTGDRFWAQRVRQAYDDLAQPWRLAWALAVWPALFLGLRRRPGAVLGAAGGVALLAEVGRRRAGGRQVYPATAALWAPVWVLERGTCTWLAMWQRLRHGGMAYGGQRVSVAAHRPRTLRRRLSASAALGGDRLLARAETGGLVGAVTEGLDPGHAAPAKRDGAAVRIDGPAAANAQHDRTADQ